MTGVARVAAVLRHRGTVLACGGGDDGGPPPRLPTGPVEDSADAAVAGLLADLGVPDATVERVGDPVETPDGPVRPFLATVESRDGVAPGTACPDPTWGEPAAFGPGDGGWWRAYRAAAPTVETVRADAERGSAAIALDALWALRDAAVEAAAEDAGLAPVEAVARALVDARPGMAALATRVDRAMAGAGVPADVADAATVGLDRASDADAAAASLAAETVGGGRVLTLSRSGTVRAALLEARPAVVVLASRPGGEGAAVADDLEAAGLAVERVVDAAVYARLRAGGVDAVLVGADAVTPDGAVVNKVGTWAAAHAARRAGVPAYAACASDKVRPLGAGPPPVGPGFDLTPPAFLEAVLTERGRLEPAGVRAVAGEHRDLAAWRR